MVTCAAAVSTRQSTSAALDEVIATLRAGQPAAPDLLFAFVTPQHQEHAAALVETFYRELSPRHLLGCTASGLIGVDREFETEEAIVALAVSAPGARIETFHATFEANDDAGRVAGVPTSLATADSESALVALADPYSFPMDGLLRHLNSEVKGVRVLGGMASGGSHDATNRLFCDERVHEEGMVGAVIGGDLLVRPIVSQGCRPIGRHFVVTKCHDNLVQELGGQPALTRLQEVLKELTPRDLELVRHALHVGRVIDEYKSSFRRGDFLIRSVIGFDQHTGAIAINDAARLGQSLQFQVRDPAAATEDLELLLAQEREFFTRHPPRGALLFACNGRGSRMFEEPDHDVKRVHSGAGGVPVAGFFAAGEIGPVGGQNFLHGFTASIAVLCERTPAP